MRAELHFRAALARKTARHHSGGTKIPNNSEALKCEIFCFQNQISGLLSPIKMGGFIVSEPEFQAMVTC